VTRETRTKSKGNQELSYQCLY